MLDGKKTAIDFDKLNDLKVLYIEDDAGIREELSETLRMDIETIYVAGNGKEGLEIYRQHLPDAIITDIRMPVMDGLEMIRQIREEDLDIPILITTAFNESDYLLKAIDLGVDGYITKPVDINKMLYMLYKSTQLFFAKRENEAKNTLLQLVMAQNPELMVVIRDDKVEFMSESWKQYKTPGAYTYQDFGQMLGDADGQPLGDTWEEKVVEIHDRVVSLLEEGKVSRYLNVSSLCILESRTFLYTFHDITKMKQEYDVLSDSYHETKEMLALQSKLASMGEMIEAIAHQWRQPLNVLSLSASKLEMELEEDSEELDRDAMEKILKVFKNQIMHMNQTIIDFKGFVQPEKSRTYFGVRDSIEQVLTLFGKQYQHANMDIKIIGGDLQLYGLQNEFQHVFINLLNNTRDALVEREINPGKVVIEIGSNLKKPSIICRDNAGGFPEDIFKRLFTERVSSKGKEGSGIGMLMSKRIIEEGMGGKYPCA